MRGDDHSGQPFGLIAGTSASGGFTNSFLTVLPDWDDSSILTPVNFLNLALAAIEVVDRFDDVPVTESDEVDLSD